MRVSESERKQMKVMQVRRAGRRASDLAAASGRVDVCRKPQTGSVRLLDRRAMGPVIFSSLMMFAITLSTGGGKHQICMSSNHIQRVIIVSVGP